MASSAIWLTEAFFSLKGRFYDLYNILWVAKVIGFTVNYSIMDQEIERVQHLYTF
jgi:uncharacterized membrane protein